MKLWQNKVKVEKKLATKGNYFHFFGFLGGQWKTHVILR